MLYYIERGEGIPVVWIHGFPLSGRIFARQLDIQGARHIVPDLPGFGNTPAADLTLEAMAREVLALMDLLEIERAVLGGLSMGGYVLLAAASMAPERFSGAMLIDTRELPDTADGRRGRQEMIEKVRSGGVSPVIESMLPKMLARNEASDQRFVREVMESASPAGVINALRAMAERPDRTETLRSLSLPLLVLVGAEDAITPPSDAERMVGIAADARLAIIPDAAHLSNVERPAVFNRHVAEFLQKRVAGSLQG